MKEISIDTWGDMPFYEIVSKIDKSLKEYDSKIRVKVSAYDSADGFMTITVYNSDIEKEYRNKRESQET